MSEPLSKVAGQIFLASFIALVVPMQVCSQPSCCEEGCWPVKVSSEATAQQENTAKSGKQETPDWANREYDSPANKVYAAALKSIQLQKHEVQAKNESIYTVDFHVGITAWSWGYNMRLVVSPIAENHSKVTVGVLRSGGKAFSWGSGQKEVRKILAGIDAELASSEANPQEHTPAAPKAQNNSACILEVRSDPTGADVELDGKFVGNTPTTLRLKPGEYTITVRKAGFAPWTRKLAAIPDNELKITAELTKD